jgi:hypothetical protein
VGDVPDVVILGMRWIGDILHRYSYVGSYGLLYLEESGVPLPAPGDVFVMYVGAHVPRSLGSWILAWLGPFKVRYPVRTTASPADMRKP